MAARRDLLCAVLLTGGLALAAGPVLGHGSEKHAAKPKAPAPKAEEPATSGSPDDAATASDGDAANETEGAPAGTPLN